MPLLIDGYNLLHVTGIVGSGSALTELHRSREALLRFLAASIEPAERPRTTIVFDAAGAPPGLPRTILHDGITVHFARDYADADDMLEDLIAAHDTPRTLVVVSSDHRVQRAARRRRAKAIDSDRWWADLCAERRRQGAESARVAAKADRQSQRRRSRLLGEPICGCAAGRTSQAARHLTGRTISTIRSRRATARISWTTAD